MRSFVFAMLAVFAGPMAAQTFDDLRVVAAGGKSVTNWHGQADLQLVQFELGRSISPRTSVGVAVGAANVWQPRSWFGHQYGDGSERVRALAMSMLVRHAFRERSRLRPYIELATGPMIAEKRVPAATSRFNFMSQAGGGVVLNANGRVPVFAGYRFLHISNGGYSSRNPGLNVSAAVVGLQFRR